MNTEIDKRSFEVGFIMATLINEADLDGIFHYILAYCRHFHMTPPTEKDFIDIVEYATYRNKVFGEQKKAFKEALQK